MKRIVIALFSVGWLLPAWLAVDSYLGFWQGDGLKLISGRKDIDSFPHLSLSRQCCGVGMIWLAVVIIFWSWRMTTIGPKKE